MISYGYGWITCLQIQVYLFLILIHRESITICCYVKRSSLFSILCFQEVRVKGEQKLHDILLVGARGCCCVQESVAIIVDDG